MEEPWGVLQSLRSVCGLGGGRCGGWHCLKLCVLRGKGWSRGSAPLITGRRVQRVFLMTCLCVYVYVYVYVWKYCVNE